MITTIFVSKLDKIRTTFCVQTGLKLNDVCPKIDRCFVLIFVLKRGQIHERFEHVFGSIRAILAELEAVENNCENGVSDFRTKIRTNVVSVENPRSKIL